jgi:chemotaxis protein CheD
MSPLPARPETFLHPGEFSFGLAPGRVGTLLGSCVAVTVWHPVRRFGGMCHILLPGRQRPAASLPDCRYADEAVERFAYELSARRVSPTSCQVKLFGGGNMFAGTRAAAMDVGRRNVDATRMALAAYGFNVMAEHVGGNARRRLFLDLTTGHVWLAVPENDQPQPRKEAA